MKRSSRCFAKTPDSAYDFGRLARAIDAPYSRRMLDQEVGFAGLVMLVLTSCGPAVQPDEGSVGSSGSSSGGAATTTTPPPDPDPCLTTGCDDTSSDGGATPPPPDLGSTVPPPPLDPPGCTIPPTCDRGAYEGDIEIETAEDAAAFAGFTEITGALLVVNSELECLDFLFCLESVGGDLVLFGNEQLTSVTGLDNVEVVGAWFENQTNEVGSVIISENHALLDFDTLNRIEQTPVSLQIAENDQMVAISGFEAMIGTQEDIVIRFNPSLADVAEDGLREVLFIGGECIVTNNELLDPLIVEGICDGSRLELR